MSLFPYDLRQTRVRVVQAGVALLAAALVAGCGSTYRPVVTPINPSGPAAQPQSLAVVISNPGPNTDGIATVIDYSGDTIMALAPIGPNPVAFTLDSNGANGYTVNSDHTLTNFQVSTSEPQEKYVTFSTLPAAAQPVGLFSPTAGLLVSDLNQNVDDVLTGSPEDFRLAVPVAPTPIGLYGLGSIGQHVYSISQNNSSTPVGSVIPFGVTCNVSPSTVSQLGEADAIESCKLHRIRPHSAWKMSGLRG